MESLESLESPRKERRDDEPRMSESAGVRFEVTRLQRITGSGWLVAVACVAPAIGGVEVTLQSIRVMRGTDGELTSHAPAWRHPGTAR